MPRSLAITSAWRGVRAAAVGVCSCLCAATLFTTAASAHEPGTTRVTATVDSDRFQIEVVTDVTSLAAKLEAMSPSRGDARADETTPDDDLRRIRELQAEFLSRVKIQFDGQAVEPSFEAQLDPIAPQEAASNPFAVPGVRIVLRGARPDVAKAFRWRYDLAFASYALTVRSPDRSDTSVWLEGGEVSQPMALGDASSGRILARAAWTSFTLGFTHILPRGIQPLLFALSLFFFNRRLAPAFWQVTVFTLGHAVTLWVAAAGLVSLSGSAIAPMIALSIAYIAVENLLTSELTRLRLGIVFAFGLVHGLGAGNAVRGLALPRAELLAAIVSFNAGVEAGQLTAIAAAFCGTAYWFRSRETYRRFVVVPASLAIAIAGILLAIEGN